MRAASILTAALMTASMGLLNSSGWAGTVSVPPLPKKTYTKATVKWPTLSATSNLAFAVTYGKTTTVCATVTPNRLASKFTWADPEGALTLTAGADPSCNGGSGGFLTIQAGIASDCTKGQRSIQAKLNGKLVSTGQGVVMRPTGTSAELALVAGCSAPFPYGTDSIWHVAFNSADAPAGIAPDFDGLMTTEVNPIVGNCISTASFHGGASWTIGPPPWPHNAIDDNNSICKNTTTSCSMTMTQYFNLGQCKTPTVNVTFSFDSNGIETITRGDGDQPATWP